MNRVQPYWKCDFQESDSTTVSRLIYAKTALQARESAFQTGFRLGISPIYDSIRRATNKEVSDFKKMIKDRVKQT